MKDFERWYNKTREGVEKFLREVVSNEKSLSPPLSSAINYAVFSGGKRVRPTLVIAVAEDNGWDSENFLPLAAGIELIHTYSLIHDDLPAMDNDDFRRGRPTIHKKFNEAMAILAGDALLTHAFFVIADGLRGKFPEKNILETVSFLSLAAGMEGMVAGQQIDVENEGRILSKKSLENMVYLKTGRLIQASVTGPIILKGMDDEIKNLWLEIGKKVGILFQVVDDILDEVGDEKKVGKKLKKDKERGKNTFVTIMGLEGAEKYRDSLFAEVMDVIPPRSILAEMVKFIVRRDY